MKYRPEQLMPKRYPENRPTVLNADYWTNGDKIWSKDFMQLYPYEFVPDTTWFIDIPGAPEELRPRKYPDEKPERAGRYVVHNSATDTWLTAYWNPLYEEWHNVSGNITGLYLAIDYFIPYPLEEEMETLDDKVDKLLDELLEATQNVKDLAVEAMSDILDKWGYDITPRQPEILPCPNPKCEDDCYLDASILEPDKYQVVCNTCEYRGPKAESYHDAIRLHNLIAGKGK